MPDASTMANMKQRRRRLFVSQASRAQMTQFCSSLLVPLMIGIFTIVTTMLQMDLAKQQREQDLRIAKQNREKDERIEESRREKDLEIANRTRLQQYEIEEARREKDFTIANQSRMLQNEIEDQRRIAEATAQEDQQMNTVLAAYLKDTAELMLSENFTLLNSLIATVVRAKTLTTLGQLDGKRKGHVVRFLYEAQMLTVDRPSVDLTDADLSHANFANYKLNGVSLSKCNLFRAIFRNAQLCNASFSGSRLLNADFESAQLMGSSFYGSHLSSVLFIKANLTQASFAHAQLIEVNFQNVIVTSTDFTGINAKDNNWYDMKGNHTIFNQADMEAGFLDRVILMNASFVKAQLWHAYMSSVTIERGDFTDTNLVYANFANSKLTGSVFDRSTAMSASFYASELEATSWRGANVKGADFSRAVLRSALITSDQMRRAARSAHVILPDGSQGSDSNLLSTGDAEGHEGQCQTQPWIVDSMTAEPYNGNIAHVFGRCYFKVSDSNQSSMKQRVQVPDEYSEWIRTDMAVIWIAARCESDDLLSMHVRQFDGNRTLPIVNDAYNGDIDMDGPDLFFAIDTLTTAIELEVVFTRSSSMSTSRGTCDNLKLAIWHRNFTA